MQWKGMVLALAATTLLAGCVTNKPKTAVVSTNKQFSNMMSLGNVSAKNGDYATAARFYIAAQRLEPKNVAPSIQLAKVVDQHGKAAAAAKILRAVLKRAPNNVQARRLYGNTLIKEKMPAAALAQYQRALNVQPASFETLNNVGYLMDLTGHHNIAQQCYQRVLKIDQKSTRTKNNLAVSQALSGHYTEAMDTLRQAQASGKVAVVENNLALIGQYARKAIAEKTEPVSLRQARVALQQKLMPGLNSMPKLTKTSIAMAEQLCGNRAVMTQTQTNAKVTTTLKQSKIAAKETAAKRNTIQTSAKIPQTVMKNTAALANERQAGIVKTVKIVKQDRPKKTAIAVTTAQQQKQLTKHTAAPGQKGFFLQLKASSSRADLKRFAHRLDLTDKTRILKTTQHNQTWYVLAYGRYHNAETARIAKSHLPKTLARYQPWVRKDLP